MLSMPDWASRWDNISPAGPPPAMATWVVSLCMAFMVQGPLQKCGSAGMVSRSKIEEHRFSLALQADVKAIARFAAGTRFAPGQQRLAPRCRLDSVQDRALRIGFGFIVEIQARIEMHVDAARKHRQVDVRRHDPAIGHFDRTGLDG